MVINPDAGLNLSLAIYMLCDLGQVIEALLASLFSS